jgi:hypothetical protein
MEQAPKMATVKSVLQSIINTVSAEQVTIGTDENKHVANDYEVKSLVYEDVFWIADLMGISDLKRNSNMDDCLGGMD